MAKKPVQGSAAEFVMLNGIESLRGVALQDGNTTIFVSNQEIDRLILEEAEDKASGDTICPVWRQWTYGGATPEAELVIKINLNTVKINRNQGQSMDHFKDLLEQYLNDPLNTAEAEHLGPMKELVRYQHQEGAWEVKCDFPGADGLTNHSVNAEDLHGWMWKKVKECMAVAGKGGLN